MIYSSIAQIGFLVSALSINTVNSIASIYFFLIIYILTSILLWTNFSIFYGFQERTNLFNGVNSTPLYLSNLSNFFKSNKLWSFSFIIIFFSVAGIPPLSGFLSKIFILFGLIESNQIIGSLVIILVSAVSVFYYLRVLKIIFFESKDNKLNNESTQIVFNSAFFDIECLILATGLFLLFFFFFFPSYLLLICNNIALGSFFF